MDELKKFNPEEHMMDLKGKKYLQVMWRIVWLRKEHPEWQISSEIVEHVWGDHAVFKAWISDPKTEMIFAEAHGSESIKDFRDYLEKAETKAIGRALAMLGYGTQFAPELDEGERIVDSPVDLKPAKVQKPAEKKPQETEEQNQPLYLCHQCHSAIKATRTKDGILTEQEIADRSYKKYGKVLCMDCARKLSKANAAEHS